MLKGRSGIVSWIPLYNVVGISAVLRNHYKSARMLIEGKTESKISGNKEEEKSPSP